MDVTEDQIVEAVKALQNPKGSTAKEIKRFLVSEGHIDKNTDIKLAILAALKSNRLARPQGARGRFLFWGSKCPPEGSKRERCKSKKRKKKPKKKAACGKKRKPKKKKRPKKKGCGQKKKKKRSKPKKKKCGGKKKRKKAKKSTTDVKCPCGKQLVVFCARATKRRAKPPPKPPGKIC